MRRPGPRNIKAHQTWTGWSRRRAVIDALTFAPLVIIRLATNARETLLHMRDWHRHTPVGRTCGHHEKVDQSWWPWFTGCSLCFIAARVSRPTHGLTTQNQRAQWRETCRGFEVRAANKPMVWCWLAKSSSDAYGLIQKFQRPGWKWTNMWQWI